MSNVVAIVGRPNVGKSTLFNRLVEKRKAITGNESGITRDRHYGISEWNGKNFAVIDTGGYVPDSKDVFEKAIREQVHIAIKEATVLIFMVDTTCGITDLDQQFANIIRKTDKPVFLVANKVDNTKQFYEINEFYKFGLGEVYPVSAMSGSGTGELLDELVNSINVEKDSYNENELPRIAILGKPNVGKSTLTNALLGENRNIVTPIAGTTRDAIHSHYKGFGKEFILIDTAGLRKRAKLKENVEFYSGIRSINALQESDVCLLMIDSSEGFTAQDVNILHIIQKSGKGVVILVNKWDLIQKSTNSAKDFEKDIREKTSPFTDIPIIFISSINKERIFKSVETALDVFENRKKRITTSQLNNTLLDIIENSPPPSAQGKFVKIKYITQLPGNFPAFVFFCNHPQLIKESYKRFIENKMRDKFNFKGVPIRLFFRNK